MRGWKSSARPSWRRKPEPGEAARGAARHHPHRAPRHADHGRAKAWLIAGVTDVVQAVLDKRRESVTVIIDEIDLDNWGEGGVPVTQRRAQRSL